MIKVKTIEPVWLDDRVYLIYTFDYSEGKTLAILYDRDEKMSYDNAIIIVFDDHALYGGIQITESEYKEYERAILHIRGIVLREVNDNGRRKI